MIEWGDVVFALHTEEQTMTKRVQIRKASAVRDYSRDTGCCLPFFAFTTQDKLGPSTLAKTFYSPSSRDDSMSLRINFDMAGIEVLSQCSKAILFIFKYYINDTSSI